VSLIPSPRNRRAIIRNQLHEFQRVAETSPDSQVRSATRQVVHAGSEKQVADAAALLRETRRRLYQLLAEDEAAGEPGA
jgi:hypothetical protein